MSKFYTYHSLPRDFQEWRTECEYHVVDNTPTWALKNVRIIRIFGKFNIAEFYVHMSSIWNEIKTYYIAWEHNYDKYDPLWEWSALIYMDKPITGIYSKSLFDRYGDVVYHIECENGWLKKTWEMYEYAFKKIHEAVDLRNGAIGVNMYWQRGTLFNIIKHNPHKPIKDVLYNLQNPY